ncbi:asparagine--tRNA ligase, cytoplasmic 2 [Euphorbia lathyris]|uniref:asparagine--tRNA ligase, cytoplasmic 2 n=1 Tax=Euphorbia lathyris TaxID=212925 RepID=UPI003313160B
MASQEPQQSKSKISDHQQSKSKISDHQEPPAIITPHFKYSNRVLLKTILQRNDGGLGLVGHKMVIGGWIKSSKEIKKQPLKLDSVADNSSPGNKDVTCIELLQTRVPLFRSIVKIFGGGSGNYTARTKLDSVVPKPPLPLPSLPSIVNLLVSDGSCVASLQVRIEFSEDFPFRTMPIGTSIVAEGVLNRLQGEGKQIIEFKAENLVYIGLVEEDKYPLSKKRLPLESLRDCTHFRPRTTTVASVMRIRSCLSFATHAFFQNHEFFSLEMPIITTTDGVGFSERFRVTTLSGKEDTKVMDDDTEGVKLEGFKLAMKEKNNLIQQLKRTESNREALFAAEQDLLKTNQLAAQSEAKHKDQSQASKSKKVDFFSNQTYLTVSGMLHLESYGCALGNVYSFGPRFRADNKNVSGKHLGEVWMVEAQMAFSQLEDAMTCAEDYLRFLCKWVLNNCEEDLKFVIKRIDKNRINLLQAMAYCSYERITYTKAVELLQKVSDKTFETQPGWGIPLTTQHLSYLADEIYKTPLIVYNYPKDVKPFYARSNDDGKTVAAFDMVVPRGGILITGCQNEERIEILEERMREVGLGKEEYEWYLDLRRHGTVKHSGFSMGFDLMVMFATGIPDVRDAIPFPRTQGMLNN